MNNIQSENMLHRIMSIDMTEYLKTTDLYPIAVSANLSYYKNEKLNCYLTLNTEQNTWSLPSDLARKRTLLEYHALAGNCSLLESIQQLSTHRLLPDKAVLKQSFLETPRLKLNNIYLDHNRIKNPTVLRLLQAQGIPASFADKFCDEYRLQVHENKKQRYGLALKSDKGLNHLLLAMEIPLKHINKLFNTYYDVTRSLDFVFQNKSTTVLNVYTSMMDLLHHQYQLHQNKVKANSFVLLSDPAVFEKARPVMETHEQINLYLPNDDTTEKYKAYAQWLSPAYKDFSTLYQGYRNLSAKADSENKVKAKHKGLGL